MKCEAAIDRLLESLTGELESSPRAELEAHWAQCVTCCEMRDGLLGLWKGLQTLPLEQPSEALRPRFYAMLHAQRPETRRRGLGEHLNGWLLGWWPRQPVWQVGLALVFLAAGLVAGPRLRRAPSELAQLRAEVESTRRLVTISMLQQRSPSQRLQGVSFTYQLQEPDTDVIEALLRTLDTDPNVDVRLAAAEALGQFLTLPQVRKGLVESFERQTSPLVQIALIDVLSAVTDADVAALLQRVAQDPELHRSVRQRAQQRPL